jgi:hypothetical protein
MYWVITFQLIFHQFRSAFTEAKLKNTFRTNEWNIDKNITKFIWSNFLLWISDEKYIQSKLIVPLL